MLLLPIIISMQAEQLVEKETNKKKKNNNMYVSSFRLSGNIIQNKNGIERIKYYRTYSI